MSSWIAMAAFIYLFAWLGSGGEWENPPRWLIRLAHWLDRKAQE